MFPYMVLSKLTKWTGIFQMDFNDWGQNGKNTPASGSGGTGGAAIAGTGFSVIGNNSDTVKGSI